MFSENVKARGNAGGDSYQFSSAIDHEIWVYVQRLMEPSISWISPKSEFFSRLRINARGLRKSNLLSKIR